jgi:hypothetical protein
MQERNDHGHRNHAPPLATATRSRSGRRHSPAAVLCDANELDVDHVHVFPADAGDRIALSFFTAVGSVNITLPLQLAGEIGAGLVRLVTDATAGRCTLKPRRVLPGTL